MEELITKLINKKAEENNTIDLNAYALGLEDALKSINYDEISKFISDIVSDYENGLIDDLETLVFRAEKLIAN